ncbi:YjgN family protein [Actibacterium mucosum]|uniref:YjgN family protein n=1 Tax=Actibacterium mucosum TaxID=1087332 RepID=UPI001F2DD076|nr:YjgN family protein [Actibacterium mucosum]
MVNVLLSILTLGIYSAWAKVRTNKYLYQHLKIDGRPFDYHATGKQILIGRIIIVLGLVAYTLAANILILNILILIAWLFLLPWLIVRSIRFNARVTSWSGLRFDFVGEAVEAFVVYILYPIVSVFTLYLTYPLVVRSQRRFRIDNFRFGRSNFEFDCSRGAFYKAFLIAGAWILAVALVVYALLPPIQSADDFLGANPSLAWAMFAPLLTYAVIFAAIIPAGFIVQAFLRNAVYNTTKLQGGHSFGSNVQPLKMIWIALSNALLVVVSVGLLLPWARIRMLGYLAAHTQVHVAGNIDDFVGSPQQAQTAVGDAYGDIEGLDIGLPL